jgi:lysophospholipase L1-like esterase
MIPFFSKKNLFYLVYLAIITLLLLEALLRVYNPFNFRIKGDRILLQANEKFVIYNKDLPGTDDTIVHTKNSLGFRGPDMPDSFRKYLSVITVGGSTTECGYISDGKTWPDILYGKLRSSFKYVWLDNAGLAGHSTFGHTVLLEDYLVKLKPKVILFLVGCNDILLDSLRPSDKSNMKGFYASSFFTYLSKNSELCNVLANLYRSDVIKKNRLDDHYYDLRKHRNDNFTLPDNIFNEKLGITRKYLDAYKERLQHLADVCMKNGIVPVLITQPAMYGEGVDAVTGVDLESVKHDENTSGKLWWSELALYNDATKEIAERNHLLVIDLAALLPKGSAYFYDYVHYNITGNRKVGELVYDKLMPYLSNRFPSYVK